MPEHPVAAAPLLTLSLDSAAVVRGADAAACEALGWPREALVGLPLAALIPEAPSAPEAARFEAQLNTAHRRHLHAEVWLSAVVDGARTVMLRETVAGLEAEHRLFGGRFSDLLRRQPDADAVLSAALQALAEELGANRATYSRTTGEGVITPIGRWTDGSVVTLDGAIDLVEVLGPRRAAALGGGETLVNPDALAHPSLTEAAARRFVERGIRGMVAAPLMHEGRLEAVLSVHTREPRAWSASEVRLVEDAAERLGEALERAQAEARLRESEEHFRTFAESLPDLAFVMDAQGQPYWWNRRHDEVFGAGAEKTIQASVHPDDREWVAAAWAAAVAAGEPLELESRLLCADGSCRPFRSQATPVRDAAGRVVRWMGMATDMSEVRARERSQAFLLDLSERLRPLGSPGEVLRLSAAALGEFLAASCVAYVKVDEAEGVAVNEHVWRREGAPRLGGRWETGSSFSRMAAAVRDGRTSVRRDLQALPDLSEAELATLKLGEMRGAVTTPLMRDGRLTCVFAVIQSEPRDWTPEEVRLVEEVAERTWAAWERAGAEARLGESEAQFRGLAENLPNLCWISTQDGRVLWGNRRYHDFYSWRVAQDGRIGESLTVHPDDREASRAAWAHAYATGEPFSLMIRSRDAAGAYRPFLCQAQPIQDAEGRVARWCGILTDFSEQQAREARERFLLELGEAVRALGDPDEILRETCARLGAHLGADRAGYGEFTEGTGDVIIRIDWAAPPLRNLKGLLHRYGEGSRTLQAYRAGELLSWADAHDLPHGGVARRLLLEVMGCRASLSVPLSRGGRLIGLFGVYKREPHVWTAEEIDLVREVGDRTWAALERSRAEAASRESEAQFRTFAESLPDIAFVVAADGAPLWWNRRYEDYFGPGLGMSNIPNMAHPDDAGWVMEAWEHAAAAGEPIFVEFRMKCLDGAFRLFKAHASPVKDEHGKVLRWAGLIRNIHEQRARENNQAFLLELGDKLRRLPDPASVLSCASEELRRHLDVDTVAFAEADETGQVVTVAHEASNGVLPSTAGGVVRFAEWRGSRLLQRFAQGEAAILSDTYAQVGDDPVRGMYEASRVRATISLPLALNGVLRAVFFASHSEPREWTQAEVQVATEVAERTWATVERARAEGAQRQTEALLTSIMDHAPVGIYVKDLEGRYLLVNPEMCKLLGKPHDQIVGRTAYDVVDPDYADEVTAHDRWVMDTGETHVSERKLGYGQTGSYDWSLITRFPVTPGEGAPRQVAGINVNLSAQKSAEAELERSREALYQSEKLSALGSLLAGVSHELNNPLSIVVAQATMMERQGQGGPLAERARHIRSAAERCARIVQTFLAMARQRAPERRRVDLNGVVEAALELTAYGLRTSGVQVVREQAPALPAISADADQLHQVVINLVINAQHALAEQPGARTLTVRTAPSDDGAGVVLEIADNGPGVPEALRRRIFDPFFTTKAQDVGTGVGLSFSQGLVEAHGGRLELSETPGGGATFRMVLPISPAPEPIVAPASVVAAASAPSRTALVVDDEPQIARALAEFLEFEGYACETAFGGAEAKARLAQGGAFDLILSDLRMPEVDGPALFAWIKAERPELAARVAFSTGDTLGSTAVRFLAQEGRPFMEKPFTPDSLRALLDDIEAAEGCAAVSGPRPLRAGS